MWKQAYNVDRNLAKYLEVYECGRRSRRTRSGVTPRQDCDWANISFQLRATARFWHARYIRTRTVVGRPIQCGRQSQSMSASIQSGIVETTKRTRPRKLRGVAWMPAMRQQRYLNLGAKSFSAPVSGSLHDVMSAERREQLWMMPLKVICLKKTLGFPC